MASLFQPGIRYVYFDFDNVLVKRAESRAALVARMLGLPDARALRDFYFVEFHQDASLEKRYLALRTVEAEIAFYRDLFRLFSDQRQLSPTDHALQAAAEAFVHVPLLVQPGVLDGLERLRGTYSLGIFTNGLPSRRQEIEASGLGRFFQNVVISSDYGFEKPAPELYAKAVAASGRPASSIALVDDEPANIIGAERASFGQVILFTPAFWQQVQ